MDELRRVLVGTLHPVATRLRTTLANRGLAIVAGLLVGYVTLIGLGHIMLHYNVISESRLTSITISLACVTFLLGQSAFLVQGKVLEAKLNIKGVGSDLVDALNADDPCISSYVAIAVNKSELIKSNLKNPTTTRTVVRELSMEAFQTCQTELAQMLKRKRIERYGNPAYSLTGECYNHVTESVKAIALANEESWEFWTNAASYGREFYERNETALGRGVEITRYFVFSAVEHDRLAIDPSYRARVTLGLSTYLNRLPKTSVWLALSREWTSYYPERVMNQERRMANAKFLQYYNGTFPDVSLFDNSVASLWQGSSSKTVDRVRIAWEPMHVLCVQDVFGVVLADLSTVKVKMAHNMKASDLLDAFIEACKPPSP